MAFIDNFLTYFNKEERSSNLVRMVANIGENTERSLLNTIEREILNSSDIGAFDSNKIRSWLAFLLLRVTGAISSRGLLNIHTGDFFAGGGGGGGITIPKNSKITTKSGKMFTTDYSLYIEPNNDYFVSITQGTIVTYSGTYKSILAIKGEKMDLDDIKVVVGGFDVPPVSALQDHIVPVNGYFSFIYNGSLFVKVFHGANVPDPEGKIVEVTYRECDGLSGDIKENTVTGFLEQYYNAAGDKIEMFFQNAETTGGKDNLSRADLVNRLRYKWAITTNIASILEFEAFLNVYPGIYGVLCRSALSDYIQTLTYDVAGRIRCYLLDADGKFISNEEKNNVTEQADIERVNRNLAHLYRLDTELEKIKDLILVEYPMGIYVNHVVVATFDKSDDDVGFTAWVKTMIRNFYSAAWTKDQGETSLFEPLDLVRLATLLSDRYNPIGLRVRVYHHVITRINYSPSQGTVFELEYLEGEKDYGESFYKIARPSVDQTTSIMTWPVDNIYLYETFNAEAGQEFKSSQIIAQNTNTRVGQRVTNVKPGRIRIQHDSLTQNKLGLGNGTSPAYLIKNDILFAFWYAGDNGYATVGNKTTNEGRVIPGVRFLSPQGVLVGRTGATWNDLATQNGFNMNLAFKVVNKIPVINTVYYRGNIPAYVT